MDFEVRGRNLGVRMLDSGTEGEFSVLFLEDTTRSREQAQQLKLAALGRLTANIAHEIRNPLAAISHAAELLGEERRDARRACASRASSTTTRQRLDRLVTDVLQLNRRDRAQRERIRAAPVAEGLHRGVRRERVGAAGALRDRVRRARR